MRGGNLRTAPDRVGLEWAYPVAPNPTARVGLGFETVVDGRLCGTRADFDALGLTSRYHSCSIVGFDWHVDGVQVEARYFLANDDALCARLTVANQAREPRRVQIGACAWMNGERRAPGEHESPWLLTDAPSPHLVVRRSDAGDLDQEIAPGSVARRLWVLARGAGLDAALAAGLAGLGLAEATFERLVAEDRRFDAGCPTLTGDWPAGWREGLIYDFETTRLLVQPPGGVFDDVWPSWMAAWPRVVFAEGTLDMLRLAYADPMLAQRAVLSMFRNAPQPNVPCVFRGGEYNMVAADGSRCGTSPAWCLPFLSLELLYLRTLDLAWLREVYPYARAFVEWWLEHRVDSEGWLVYKCSWEAGEDGNPRLDPRGSGDADISGRLRPVELQATVAHAADVLAFFAQELGQTTDLPRWRAVQRASRDRTRLLFDAEAGRFRDQVLEPPSNEHQLYWGVDPHRFSAQSLTPLLIGEPLARAEIVRHLVPPWTLWPSWTTTLVESAAAAGLLAEVGALAFETIDRVYSVTTRRNLDNLVRPLPGCASEFWPEDWQTYAGSDAYGWGATTANLLIRHLFGLKESRVTDSWCIELAPALPEPLRLAGRTYGIRHLRYRGQVFDLAYRPLSDGALMAELDLGDQPRQCIVQDTDGAATLVSESRRPGSHYSFRIEIGRPVTLRLK